MTGMVERVDAVVVGSGFGGSVAAYRLAEAGRSVVLLERGRRYPPGSFARAPYEVSRNFWDPGKGMRGLYDAWAFPGFLGLVSAGLGGGSLIYANVLMRKPEKWFVRESPLPGGGYEHWPVTRADLDPHYDRVEAMLAPVPYPYSDTPKTLAMEQAGARLGLHVDRPPLAISFGAVGQPPSPRVPLPIAPYGNLHRLPRVSCRGCGECCLGCNDGAKNTLDHTYLSAAADQGADLRTDAGVKGIRSLPGGDWEVRYADYSAVPPDHPEAVLRSIRCERLILGAGALGTTRLLLRNRSALPTLSPALGTRFSGNGDVLGFVFDATHPDGRPLGLHADKGPVITTAITVRDDVDGGRYGARGHVVEDAGVPVAYLWMGEAARWSTRLAAVGAAVADTLWDVLRDSGDTRISDELAMALGPGDGSRALLPLLGMGRDIADGVVSLHHGRLMVNWYTSTSRDYFAQLRQTMVAISREFGGRFVDNPLWQAKRVITVHPLGGAPMGRTATEGVCDSFGRVFGLPGLYLSDGAVFPGPVGGNPALTIAAHSDRMCDALLAEPGRPEVVSGFPAPRLVRDPVRPRLPAIDPDAEPAEASRRWTSVSFTEWMRGHVCLGESDPHRGRARGRQERTRLMFELTITADDVERFVAEPGHEGTATGFVECDALGGRFPVQAGWFNLFQPAARKQHRTMDYRLWFSGPAGNPMTLVGRKDIDGGLDVLRDTTTLYVRILQGHHAGEDESAEVLAAGIISIKLTDFVRQLATFRSVGAAPRQGLESFGRLFLGELWTVYGPRLGER